MWDSVRTQIKFASGSECSRIQNVCLCMQPKQFLSIAWRVLPSILLRLSVEERFDAIGKWVTTPAGTETWAQVWTLQPNQRDEFVLSPSKPQKKLFAVWFCFFEFDKHFQPEQSEQNLLGAHASCWLVPLLQVVNLNLGEAEDTPKSKHSTDKKAKWLLRELLKRVLTDENIEESRKNSARCIESCYWAYASFNKSSMLLADLTDAKENIEADGTLVIQAWCQNCCPSCRETWKCWRSWKK